MVSVDGNAFLWGFASIKGGVTWIMKLRVLRVVPTESCTLCLMVSVPSRVANTLDKMAE